jgi:hypothetical protein
MNNDGSASRQLSDFPFAEMREQFENYLLSLGATMHGDWYQLPSVNEISVGITTTWEMGGQCYELSYRTSGEGILYILQDFYWETY